MRHLSSVVACIAGALSVPVVAQNTLDWPTGRLVPYHLDSGPIVNGGAAGTAYFDVVQVRNTTWLRLYFGEIELARGSFIRITSPLDGEIQELDRRGLAQWGNTSAYFNGDTVFVELVAGPGPAVNRLVIEQVAMDAQPVGGQGECGICGNSDDRVPSSENWASRLLPAGCTASVFNASSCLVSAGHCISGSMVIHFNVPDSNGNCSINNPPVADQFPILTTDSVNGGVGNDWSVLIPGTNNLGELPYERYGQLRPIASAPASPGDQATVWGYGVDNTCVRSQTQQTHSGPITSINGTTYEWEIDIRGGNSGSSLIHDGEIIGIVTHCNTGGCPNFDNLGTRIDIPAFAAAREDLCGGENLNFTFPDGLPELIAPSGGTTVRVVVSADTGSPMPGTGLVHISVDGGSFVSSAMTENSPNDYDAVFPSMDCGSFVDFYFSAETTTGAVVTSPDAAPDQTYSAIAGDNVTSEFDDDFESDQGWTVTTTASDGPWERAVPITHAVCNRGNPGSDADGSGQCYVTDNSSANSCNSDVDSGSTTLTSPTMDASDPNSVISYYRWYSTAAGGSPFQDIFVVEVSDDNGSSWTNLETVGPAGPEVSGGWFRKAFLVGDVVNTTNQFRIRFIASDTDPQSVVEAGVDGVELTSVSCGLCGNGVEDPGENCANCPADVQCNNDEECVGGVCQALCGNGVPDPGENCTNCPQDVTCSPGTECINGNCVAQCGNGEPDPGEDCANCPEDIQCPDGTECVNGMCERLCGNGVIDPGEDCANCPQDAPCPKGSECVNGMCEQLCGNGVVNPGEDCENCPADVMCPPGTACVNGMCEPLCGNGVVDPGEDCANCPADVQCAGDEECFKGVCVPICGNGVVDPGEDCETCPADVQCAGDEECLKGVCVPICGNGVVDPGEDCETCPADVQCEPGEECLKGVCLALCGNGEPDPGEDCETCPADVPCGPGEQCNKGVCETTCPWDLDGSGAVATADLLDLLSQWGTNPGGPPDFDGSGSVGTADLLKLLSNWGACP